MSKAIAVRREPGWLSLLAAIVADSPRLENALCRGHWELFDAVDGGGIEAAARICHRCPERERCASWSASRTDVSGVLGGSYRSHYSDKPTKYEGLHND